MRKTNPFYLSKEWRRLRREILKADRYECQYCKAKGQYTKATHVHHEFHRDKFPQYELDEYVERDGKWVKNLVPLCFECHMEAHDHQHRPREPLTKERW